MIRNTIIFILLAILFTACQENKFRLQYDHQNILYIDKSAMPELEINESVYVPAYSDLYYESQEKKTFFTVILSLRNISFTDTLYFTHIDYYSSHGKLLRQYIDRVLVLRPMESMEYIVREMPKRRGYRCQFCRQLFGKGKFKKSSLY